MIFSRWRPDTGGYDYFDSPSTRYGLGDDLPVPRLPKVHALGACSTDVGRAIPSDAVAIGSGPIARGMVAPMGKVGGGLLGAIDFALSDAGAKALLFGALALVGVGVFMSRKKKR
jgi:hypothetical protein